MAGPSVIENWNSIKKRVENAKLRSQFSCTNVCVIGVSKLQPEDKMREGIRAGVSDFGENYVQELTKKIIAFESEKVRWHLIGPLQSNKAKHVIGLVDMIHTVDRESLAKTLSDLALKQNIKQKILIQVNIADEKSKSGVQSQEVSSFAESLQELPGIEVMGLMTMPPFSEDPEHSRPHFRTLREVRDRLNQKIFLTKKIQFLSMGTSQDFEVAVEEGATHIRVGSLIFGERLK